MGGWIKRHWLALFGAIPLLLPAAAVMLISSSRELPTLDGYAIC
jgi:hypothetical protein